MIDWGIADWGIADERINAALAAVGRAPSDQEQRDEEFARTAWSVLVEPGDGTAGALIRHLGAAGALRMLLQRASVAAIVDATEREVPEQSVAEAIARWMPRLRSGDVLRALDGAARCSARLLLPGDGAWPVGVDDLGDFAPVVLWVRGDITALSRPAIAVVGARAATGYGEHVAMELSAGLVGRGAAVVSGGAYGIDGMAHRAALASGGTTVAVLAGGIDRFYPAGHEALLERIVQCGAVVAEAPCGSPPTKWRFLQRNRIIAAMTRATVVVEAGRRSGALNTAHHAMSLGRELGAVPGPITSAASAGCHRLLREHPATCVTSAAEVMALAFGADGVLPDAGTDAGAQTDAQRVAETDARRVAGTGTGTGTDAQTDARTDAQDDGSPASTAAGGGLHSPREDPVITRVVDALRPRRWQSIDELARAVGESAPNVRGALGILALEGRAVGDDQQRWRRPPTPSVVRAGRDARADAVTAGLGSRAE